ncbi:MarR family transcriptional regulator [Paenibacillus vortex V453]|jgi:DNA-binding MarR family transcriptional regulator|uniref:MarR family transcriptional regulator n=3 Tax=Bacteria TaxID=2 RepID=A0A163DVP3_9BACL|nr:MULTISPECIES: MarR family transcriptional regulator [Paenibacillus]AWP27208.1 MarR family transcriptional regulator [Paenibacillus sp. Cedars]EFU39793.1 MarR family transcriptional regulator [Paenibacillus vortex V453]KZS43459.1 MarR family transcriptional regulator [Paenibacillus glucanolyticus]MDH6670607.1 DNA-binding MarR family transcriptional regulator [Paenibacillus sp. LBL]MPY17891.1 MarR family transcriptional regulator [Paenibacillus glucanolyticus]
MSTEQTHTLITSWLSLTQVQAMITHELEQTLQQKHDLTLNEFYVLLFLSESPEKKLRLQQLQTMVGLSQSAISRLVSRFEAKSCGAMQRAICEDDRRGIYTSLTHIGEEKLQKAKATVQGVLEQQFSAPKLKHGLQDVLKQVQA